MTKLSTAVYTAFHGYSWSRIPEGFTERLLDRLRELAAENRGTFPDPGSCDRGVVAIGPFAAAFTIRNAPAWDSAGRASEYAAFAFFKSADADSFDFGKLIEIPFFATPSREVPSSVDYDGPAAESAPLTTAGQLVCRRHLDAIPSAQAGDLLAKYFTRSNEWTFRANSDGTMSVDCAEWRSRTEVKP